MITYSIKEENKSTVDGTTQSITFVTSVTWSNITNTPTTISGYGITDAYTKTESNANYLGKTATAADSHELGGVEENTASVANTIVKRDGSKNIYCNNLYFG